MKLHKKAFTLVELIVVITILAILGTIAFISMEGYSASSRDSVRISDVSNMKTSIELFHLNAGKYPIPDNAEIVTYEGDTLWSQGTFGSTVVSNVSRNLNEIPTDPLSDKEYIYSTSGNRNEFQILNLLEGDLALNTVTQTNAANTTRIPRLDGVFNGVFIKTANYIVPVPSLITSEELPLVLDNINIKSQVITGGTNIPNVGGVTTATGELTGLVLSVFTGTIDKNSTTQNKLDLMTAIHTAYTGSSLKDNDIYKVMLSAITEEDIVALVDTVVLDKTTGSAVVVNDGSIVIENITVYPDNTFNQDGFDWYNVVVSDWNNIKIANFMSACESFDTKLVYNYGSNGGRRYPGASVAQYCEGGWGCTFKSAATEGRLAFAANTISTGGPGHKYGVSYGAAGITGGVNLTTTACNVISARECDVSFLDTIIPVTAIPDTDSVYIPCK